MGLSKFKKLADKPKAKKTTADAIIDPAMEEVCNNLVKTSAALKNAKAAHENVQAEIIDYMQPKHIEALRSNSLTKTFDLNDKVKCIFTDRFKALTAEDIKEFEERLIEKNVAVEKLLKERVSLKLKKHVEDDEDKLNKLIEALGEDLLERYFEIKVETVPVKDFYTAVVREDVVDELEDVIERIRYKPTVKVS